MKRLFLVLAIAVAGLLAPTYGAHAEGGPSFLFRIPSGLPILTEVRDVAVDAQGNIYAALGSGNVVKLAPQGRELWRIGSLGSGDGQFSRPEGIAVD